MRRAREGRETKRVSFSYAKLYVCDIACSSHDAQKDCRLSHQHPTYMRYVHPTPPPALNIEPDAGRLRSAALTSRLP